MDRPCLPAIHFLLLPGVDAAIFLGDLLRHFLLDEHTAQRLADESVRYAYLTRIHIRSELLANRNSIRKNGFALLDSEALAEFAAARRAMEHYQTDYALRLSCPTEGGTARLNLDATWSCA